ncbi:MAG: 4Fe-4S binding protein, partial [Gammaproteobacteria bacterium]|nr:4Fe-4S binding protein [Gammaproteobacteria bacterium]
MTMMHPGLPQEWILVSACFMAFVCIYAVFTPLPTVGKTSPARRLSSWPLLAPLAHWVTRRWLLTLLRIVLVAVFLLVIVAGLFGTPIAERNMATTVTWTLWWSGVVLSVLFFGSAWCAVCPWDTLAGWLVKSRFWGKGAEPLRLNIRVPIPLRNIVPAILLFIGL